MRYFLSFLGLATLLLVVSGLGPLSLSELQWWLLNTEPPTAAIAGPQSPLRGQARFSLRLEPPGRGSVVGAWVDGTTVPPSEELAIDTARLADGAHRLVVVVRDSSLRRNASQQTHTFLSDNTPPRLAIRTEPGAPTEGGTLVVRAQLDEEATLRGRLGERDLLFQGAGHHRWAIIGIPPEPAYRALDLQLQAVDVAGNDTSWQRRYPLVLTRFATESVDVPAALEVLLTDQARAEELARLMPIYTAMPGPPRWEGRFLPPVDGPLTTLFGTRRSYNGRFPSGNHAGVDLAAPLGAPVQAPNHGRVAFAGELDIRGRALVVDHGAGVFSTYAHLQEVLVAEGDLVRRGDLIALVGSTGLSTGPHLHWEVWVGGANVDPMEWTEREMPGVP